MLAKLLLSRRVHRRALHHAFNSGDIRQRPYFHAVRRVVGADEESDAENDYREDASQYRVYRKRYEFNYSLIVSKSLQRPPVRLQAIQK